MNTWFRSAFLAVAAFAVLGLASQALAQTACEFESGAPFGLCTAYCEAMDCDSANPQASPTACAKVLGQWNKKTNSRDIPCPSVGPSVPSAFGECPLSTTVLTDDCNDSGPGFFVLYDPETPDSPPAICACAVVDTLACIDVPGAPDACFGPDDRVISTSGANVVGLEDPQGGTHISTVYCYAIDGIRICQTFTLAD